MSVGAGKKEKLSDSLKFSLSLMMVCLCFFARISSFPLVSDYPTAKHSPHISPIGSSILGSTQLMPVAEVFSTLVGTSVSPQLVPESQNLVLGVHRFV